ncbi:hypothetical protein Taro_018491 [Colocasia esculenta]|uniref:Uncharacterized protein n=1 Tax=Colocasia esculenta TaxID=4460 RepID=A0A843UTZ2_COLES|nr:hypothetical protein [Colocasia esculenta]
MTGSFNLRLILRRKRLFLWNVRLVLISLRLVLMSLRLVLISLRLVLTSLRLVLRRCHYLSLNDPNLSLSSSEVPEHNSRSSTIPYKILEVSGEYAMIKAGAVLKMIDEEKVDLSLTGVDTAVTESFFLWTGVDLSAGFLRTFSLHMSLLIFLLVLGDVGIGLKKHKGSKNREESSHCRQKDFWKALGGSLGVDTLSQTGRKTSLGEVSSVDTTSSRVDTLEITAKQAFWEGSLVLTPSGLVSTHYLGLLTGFTGSWV